MLIRPQRYQLCYSQTDKPMRSHNLLHLIDDNELNRSLRSVESDNVCSARLGLQSKIPDKKPRDKNDNGKMPIRFSMQTRQISILLSSPVILDNSDYIYLE